MKVPEKTVVTLTFVGDIVVSALIRGDQVTCSVRPVVQRYAFDIVSQIAGVGVVYHGACIATIWLR